MIDRLEVRKQWLERVHAVGRAQSRHLWVTLVAAIFFFALRHSATNGEKVTVPLIDLKLDAQAVLAAGPFILALLIVATLGSMRAWRDALEQYAGKNWRAAADRLDSYPKCA